ncbi:NAD(P)-binding domain-containing protein [Acetobacteraceae bacterium H6797]|nr:NAD(P)-binding domain-containing protein [Acetobacteraceae bacterium H6797]
MSDRLPIAIIGAGPVGLAAAAHLLVRGERPLVLEAGPAVGHAVAQWAHVRLFTPWRYCLDGAARRLLEASGWQAPPEEEIPTGRDLIARYLAPLGALLAPHITLNARVSAITRQGADKAKDAGRAGRPFLLRIGEEEVVAARAVIDASGTWFTPSPAGADGLPALGERRAAARVQYGIPGILGAERARHAGRHTVVLGGGHSALNSLIDLATLAREAPATRITWLMRKATVEAAFGGEGADALAARGALGSAARSLVESGTVTVRSPFLVEAVRETGAGLVIEGAGGTRVEADELIVATGFRPDLAPLSELRLALDPALDCAAKLGPLIDPNIHSCGTVRPHGAAELAHPEPGFYIAGMKSYGRAPTFLLATGHEQVRSIAAALAGDAEAAARVELELPETGVCNTGPVTRQRVSVTAATGCCAPQPKPACCG